MKSICWYVVSYETNIQQTAKRLSYNNPCFQYNITIMDFLVSHTCEMMFYDVRGRSTVHTCMYS